MEKSRLKGKILLELDTLISLSCKSPKSFKKYKELHVALLKKYYNAAYVDIDYHRHRVKMDIVTDDAMYHPNKVNTHLPILYTNLLFDNLKTFLRSCIDKDDKSIGFYSQLLSAFTGQKLRPTLV